MVFIMSSSLYFLVLLLWTTSCQVSAEFRLDDKMENFHICENTLPGEEIYTLTSVGGKDDITYWFSNDDSIPFTMVGGPRNTNGKVELETELSWQAVKTYRVIIVAEDSSTPPLLTTATSTITVDDSNNNAPLFLDTPYIVELLEGDTTGDIVQRVRANDYDNGQDGAVSFSLLDGNDGDDFDMSKINAVGADFFADILMAVNLDFETSQSHSVTILAEDGGDKSSTCGTRFSLNSTTNLYLTVADAPDTPPVFYREFYTAHVEENTKTFIDLDEFVVEARDGDRGLNWDIQYSLDGGGAVFSIDVTTGQIRIDGDIDRESTDDENGLFTLTVTATEIKPSGADAFTGFPGAESTNKTVTIHVDDQDDNPPRFYNNSESSVEAKHFSLTIPEDTRSTVPDFSFNVRDIDTDVYAGFSLTLLGEDKDLFQLSTTGGTLDADVTLKVVGELDYETKKVLNFRVKAAGTADGLRQSTATFEVVLEDVNDNSPVFKTSDVEATVPEHSPVGTPVVRIQATDLDSGEYGNVSYTLLPSDSFEINADGEVSVKDGNLDREKRDMYYLTVRAEDGDGRINTTQLTITLEDINDVQPVFQPSQYSVNWDENDDSVSVSVYALDGDKGGSNNSLLSLEFQDPLMNANYSITPTIDEAGTISGEIKPLKALNAEEIDGECNSGVIEYSFGIVVYDHGEPRNNGTAEILVYLRDENDHEPIFEQDTYEGEVPEYSEYDTEIAAILAKDDDRCSPNSDITYTVDSEFSQFLVSQENGTWSLRVRSTQLDRNVQDSYDVIVYAIDNGQPRKTGSTTVNVTITDINNKPPVFDEDKSDTIISVIENATNGTLIGTVVATDLDENFNLTYSITKVVCVDENENLVESGSCGDWFRIETVPQGGNISVASELDRETVEQVTLTIEVVDLNAEGSEEQTDSITVEIQIMDFNDNPPEFDEENPEFSVIEEVANGTSIGQLSASDMDIPSSKGITFYTNDPFVDITPQGELQVRNRINREGQPGDSFEAVIFATDNGVPALESNVTVSFIVADTNDNSPVFANASYVCEVQEELEAGAAVCTITATDADKGENAELLYIVNPGDSFVVNSDTGEISTLITFDRESKDQRINQFKLKAKDKAGDLSREAEVDVVVNILDIDDNEPTYKGVLPQNMEIDEENKENESVGFVKEASDADTEEFRENYYFLVYESESDPRDVFSLNKTSRELIAAEVLDREESSSYTLYVLTTNETTIESDIYPTDMVDVILTVNVALVDINDNKPTFSQRTYTSDMSWDTQPSDTDVIVSVKATDLDEGQNALLTYSILQQSFIDSAEQSRDVTIFTIRKTNGEGYIYLTSAPNLSQDDREGGQYRLDLIVQDGGDGKLSDTATVFVKIFDVTEIVIIESLHSVEYLDENRDQLEKDLEAALNADVVIDAITPHGDAEAQAQAQAARAETGQSTPQSDVYFHATVWNESTVVPADAIATSLDSAENNELRATWSIVGIDNGQPTVEPISEAASLKTVLAVACVIIVVILIVYTIAFVCMRRSYKTKMKAAKATEEAAQQTLDSYNAAKGGDLNIPGSNMNAAGESALYVENQKGNIDMEQFRVYQEIADGDSNSIDDNAVDSQDSIVSGGYMDMAGNELDDLGDLDIDHDWNTENSATNLAAALNASKKRGGEENIILMFDNPGMDHDDTVM